MLVSPVALTILSVIKSSRSSRTFTTLARTNCLAHPLMTPVQSPTHSSFLSWQKRMTYFDPEEVRRALDAQFTVEARN